MKKISLRDVAFYGLILMILVGTLWTLQHMNATAAPSYAQVRRELEPVSYTHLHFNAIEEVTENGISPPCSAVTISFLSPRGSPCIFPPFLI